MKPTKEKYRLLMEHLPDPYAYHQIVTDSSGKPADYIFLEVNPAFEEMTGFSREQVIGKKATELHPQIENSRLAWIDTFGKVALTGESMHCEHYFNASERWYAITACSDEPGYFAVFFRDITEVKQAKAEQRRIEWMLDTGKIENLKETLVQLEPSYGSLTQLNTSRYILDSTGEDMLADIAKDYLGLLETSTAIYEKNGDYALGLFSSGWCRFLDNASRWLCQTDDNRIALQSGKWLCHESCWTDASKTAIEKGEPVDIACHGGLRLYTVPIWANHEVVGVINFGYGDPPQEPAELQKIADKYAVNPDELRKYAEAYESRPPFIIGLAKERLHSSAKLIGTMLERKQVEESLQKSEERYRQLVENANEAIDIVQDGVHKFANPKMEELFECSKEEFLFKPVLDFIHPEDKNTVSARIENREKMKVLEDEYVVRIITQKGNVKWVEVSAAIIDWENRPASLSLLNDITEQKKAEEALRESEEKYRSIFENSPLGVLHFDREGTITACNDNFVEIIGSSQKALVGLNMLKLPDKQIVAAVQEALNGGRGFYEGWYHSVTAPKVTPVRILFTSFVKEEGYINGGVGIVEDITDRKQAEEALRESEEMFRYIAEFSPMPISIIDGEGNYKYINRQFAEVFGYTLEDIPTGQDWFKLAYPDPYSRQEALEFWKNDLQEKGKDEVRPRTFKITCKDGAVKDILFRPVLMDNGRNMIIYEDITEREHFLDRLRYLSLHDQLTELYNRHYLEEEIQRLDTERQLPISIIMVDLNGLKLVNDVYGHETGDEMLKSAAGIIKNSARREDIVGRWGGDEFVILLPRTPVEEIQKIHRRIKDNCRGVDVKGLPVSLAVGGGTKETAEKSLQAVLKEAEDSMYKQKLAEQKSVRSSVLKTLLQTLQTKSHETEAHTMRMLNMAWKIGEKIGLVDTELNRLNLAITLHDIGKINIPETTLTKEGSLSDEEWEIIKTHPEIGYRITRASEEFAHVSEDLLAHHERWDGRGYPRGLKEKEIPLLARITAIVDAYDVMSNGRPYKEPLSQEEIITEIRRCAGTQFDPELVEIFLAVLETE